MTIEERTLETVKDFLQNVIIVDDHAYVSGLEAAVPSATLGDDESPFTEFSGEEVEQGDFDEAAPSSLQDLDTKGVVDGFADFGMACSVLAPEVTQVDADLKRASLLAHRADVIILDWILLPVALATAQKSRTSLPFIRRILESDAKEGGRPRLICVYTGEPNGDAIVEEIRAEVPAAVPLSGSSNRGLDIGSARIVVLGKERLHVAVDIESVPASDLARRMVLEFAQLVCTGLIREVALAALAVVRDQSHKLLRRFEGDLDAALISHRSTTSSSDLEQFIQWLVGSELASVVSTADLTALLADDRFAAKVDSALGERESVRYWKTYRPQNTSQLTRDVARSALVDGIDRGGRVVGHSQKLDPKYSRTPMLLQGDDQEVLAQASDIDRRFSVLSALSRDASLEGEDSKAPNLQLGAILMETVRVSQWSENVSSNVSSPVVGPELARFYLCVQPVCDSVRLTSATSFPLLPLKVSRTDENNYVVALQGMRFGLLHDGSKLSDLQFEKFLPVTARKRVEAGWDHLDGWSFKSVGSRRFVWLGSLRLDQAHRLLRSVMDSAGRIGFDEYDYFRLHSSTK